MLNGEKCLWFKLALIYACIWKNRHILQKVDKFEKIRLKKVYFYKSCLQLSCEYEKLCLKNSTDTVYFIKIIHIIVMEFLYA